MQGKKAGRGRRAGRERERDWNCWHAAPSDLAVNCDIYGLTSHPLACHRVVQLFSCLKRVHICICVRACVHTFAVAAITHSQLRPATDEAAGGRHGAGAARRNEGAKPFSLWQALFSPSDISRATFGHPEAQRCVVASGDAGRAGGDRHVHLPEADLMDVVLLPLALLPGRLGATTRLRISLALTHLFRYSLLHMPLPL